MRSETPFGRCAERLGIVSVRHRVLLCSLTTTCAPWLPTLSLPSAHPLPRVERTIPQDWLPVTAEYRQQRERHPGDETTATGLGSLARRFFQPEAGRVSLGGKITPGIGCEDFVRGATALTTPRPLDFGDRPRRSLRPAYLAALIRLIRTRAPPDPTAHPVDDHAVEGGSGKWGNGRERFRGTVETHREFSAPFCRDSTRSHPNTA